MVISLSVSSVGVFFLLIDSTSALAVSITISPERFTSYMNTTIRLQVRALYPGVTPTYLSWSTGRWTNINHHYACSIFTSLKFLSNKKLNPLGPIIYSHFFMVYKTYISDKETYLQDFLEILNHSLHYYLKILKICFLGTTYMVIYVLIFNHTVGS